jgi:hypothetical protein
LFTGRPGPGRIGLIDLGLIAVLTDDEAANYIGFLRAVGEGDGGKAADCVLRWGVAQEGKGPEAEDSVAGFRAAVIASFAEVCRGYGTNIQLGQVLQVTLSAPQPASPTVRPLRYLRRSCSHPSPRPVSALTPSPFAEVSPQVVLSHLRTY